MKSTWFLNFGGQAKCKLVLVVGSWPSLVFLEWWSRCEWRNMNKSDKSCLFLRLQFAQSLITFLIAGNFTECVQVQLIWKLSRFFDTWREAQFSSPIPVVPSLKKKKERKEKRLSIARTKIDHEKYRLLSAGHSVIGLFCISTFLLFEQVLSCWVMIIPITLPQHQHTFCQRRCFDQDCPGLRQVEMNKTKSAWPTLYSLANGRMSYY